MINEYELRQQIRESPEFRERLRAMMAEDAKVLETIADGVSAVRGLPPEPVVGDRFRRGDEHSPVMTVSKVEQDANGRPWAILDDGEHEPGRVPSDSLRFGDSGWVRVAGE